jgi:transposase-like protein
MTKTQYGQQHIIDWKESGIAPALYCAQNGIKPNTMYHWRRKLNLPAPKPNKLVPVMVRSAAPARVLLGSQVAIALPVERIAA